MPMTRQQLRMSNSIQLRFFQDRCGYLHSRFYVPALPFVFTLLVLLQNPLLAQAPEGTIRRSSQGCYRRCRDEDDSPSQAAAVWGRAGRGDEC